MSLSLVSMLHILTNSVVAIPTLHIILKYNLGKWTADKTSQKAGLKNICALVFQKLHLRKDLEGSTSQ